MAMDKQVVEEMMKYAQDAGSFVKEQAPLVVQELLTRGMFTSVLWIVADIMLIFICSVLYIKTRETYIPAMERGDGGPTLLHWGSTILAAFCLGDIFFMTYKILNILYCPRLYVLEYLGSLVK